MVDYPEPLSRRAFLVAASSQVVVAQGTTSTDEPGGY